MNKEDKINKILEMSKEIMNLSSVSDEEIDKLYIQTKITLSALKEIKGDNND